MGRRGWWKLEITGVDELNDLDKEHIAAKIAEGYTQGEVIQDDEEDEQEEPK